MSETPHFPIYMDYSATNPFDERVVHAMVPWLRNHFGNPASSSHAWGWEAEAAVEKAREHVAALIGADPREIVWTSGATESNNLALKGAAHFYQGKGRHIITVKTEHKGVLFHVDAAQATGRIDIDMARLPIDLMSLTSHKTYGPKGIGALFVRRKPRIRIEAQMHGGGHERGMRSGTLPTHQCVGMGAAYALAKAEMHAELPRIQALHDRLLAGLSQIEESFINGHATRRVPHNLNMSFNYVEGESLIMGIKGLAVSSGSACTSASLEP